MFSRNSSQTNDSSIVIAYINIRLSSLCFSLWKDIFNYRDISYVSFFNCGLVYLLINVYSDLSQSALKYLKNTEVNFGNTLIMTGDFNIRDSIWNSNFPHHFLHSDILFEVADSLHLELSRPTEQVPTKYLDNQQDSNSVINLMLLRPESLEHNYHTIHPDWKLISDHASLTVNISIFEEHIQTRKRMLVKNSEKEEFFVKELIEAIKRLNMENIQSKKVFEQIVYLFASDTERIWYEHLKVVNITKHSKNW